MLPTFLLLICFTLSASGNQLSKSFLRIQSNDEESSITPQRMLGEDPVLTSVQHTVILPPPGPPGPGGESQPTIVTTETYVQDVPNEEEIIIEVKDNQDPTEEIEIIGNEQPQITNGDDVVITSWWTLEGEPTAFENWGQLKDYFGAQYGLEPAIGFDVNGEDVSDGIEIVVPEEEESQDQETVEIVEEIIEEWSSDNEEEIDDGRYGSGDENKSNKPCTLIVTCQKVFTRQDGWKYICKNQRVCPK